MNKNLNFEAVKGYHLNLRELNDDQILFLKENLIKDFRDFEGENNLFHYGFSVPNNEYRFFNFACFSLGQISEEISFDEFVDKLNLPKPEYDPKDVAFNQRKILGYKLIKPEYKEAVNYIAKQHPEHPVQDFYFNKHWDKFIIPRLEKAGVLDLWFSPVYDNSITLKSGVKLSEDDIPEVKEIIEIRQVCKDLAK